MARKPKPLFPASRRATKDFTGGAPTAKRSIPIDSKPGRIGTGKSPMTKGLFPPTKKGK